jgi:hypothetical protein
VVVTLSSKRSFGAARSNRWIRAEPPRGFTDSEKTCEIARQPRPERLVERSNRAPSQRTILDIARNLIGIDVRAADIERRQLCQLAQVRRVLADQLLHDVALRRCADSEGPRCEHNTGREGAWCDRRECVGAYAPNTRREHSANATSPPASSPLENLIVCDMSSGDPLGRGGTRVVELRLHVLRAPEPVEQYPWTVHDLVALLDRYEAVAELRSMTSVEQIAVASAMVAEQEGYSTAAATLSLRIRAQASAITLETSIRTSPSRASALTNTEMLARHR